MNLLIRSAQIKSPSSSFHNLTKDIRIENGVIQEIEDNISFEGEVITSEGLKVSPGWFDLRAHYCDPGDEHREDLASGTRVAAAGGFTDVALLPNTNPVISGKNNLSYYQKWNRSSAVQLHPMAALTLNCEGKELTEMIDLNATGAVAFTDGIKPIWHTDVMLKGLQYVQKFNGLLINRPEDQWLTAFGHMNEGKTSTLLGLSGMPKLAETIMIERDLKLLEYTGGRLHFALVSTHESIELIKAAKKKGLNVTCDVGINYLKFTEEAVGDYDSCLKVNPPYRTEEDRMALMNAVKDGTINAIVSDHLPFDEERKKLEFDLAAFGTSNQQAFYAVLIDVFGNEADDLLPLFTSAPRELLGLSSPQIAIGEEACLTLFNDQSWNFDASSNQSKSVASPYFGQTMKGKVMGVLNNGQLLMND